MRFEYKYIVHESLMDKLRQTIMPFVRADRYSEAGGKGQYIVRSIYFDTPKFDYFFEKIDGIRDRKKIRMRGYNDDGNDPTVFLEIKRKFNIPIVKERVSLPFSEAIRIFENLHRGNIHNHNGYAAEARRFFYHLMASRLLPVITVIYEREAYFDRFDGTVRLTFDKNLRSNAFPSLDELFGEGGAIRSLDRHFILEVKFNKAFPQWLMPVQSAFGLVKQSASKYCICVSQHNITDTPNKFYALVRSKWFSNQYL